MQFVQVLWFYIIWHYTSAWQDIFRIIGNYLWFVQNYFSMGLLASTLFSPWRRLVEHGGKGMGQSYIAALFLNFISRGVGFGVRLLTILGGALTLFAVIVLGFFFVVIWLCLPLAVLFLLLAGIGNIVRGLFYML